MILLIGSVGLVEAKSAKDYVDSGLRKDADKAVQDYNKAIQLDPDCLEAYFLRGQTYERKGEYDKAIHDLNKTIQFYPEEVSAYNVLALILATCPESKYRNGAKAVELTEKALSLGGEKWDCVSILAASYAEAGQFDNAVRMQEKAIKLAKEENSEYKDIVETEAEEQLRSYKQRKPWREYPK